MRREARRLVGLRWRRVVGVVTVVLAASVALSTWALAGTSSEPGGTDHRSWAKMPAWAELSAGLAGVTGQGGEVIVQFAEGVEPGHDAHGRRGEGQAQEGKRTGW